jgi:hypothetical protein
MKRQRRLGWLAFALAPAAWATPTSEDAVKEIPLGTGYSYTQVESIPARSRWDNWRAIDRDSLIVWVSPRRPYLIELGRGSPDLRNAQTIGVTSTTFKVRTKLDSVIVRGIDYPIAGIFELEPEDARDMTRGERS